MWHRIARKLVPSSVSYRSVVFFTFDLASSVLPEVPAHPAIEHHCFDSPQSELLLRLCEAYPDKGFRQRMLQGDQQAYAIVIQGQIAAFAWVTSSPCMVSEIHYILALGGDHIYIYDCYVLHDFRSQGLYQALLRKILADYKNQCGHAEHRLTACIAAESANTASIRGIKGAGFKEFTRARYLSLGRCSRIYGVDKLIHYSP